MQTMSKFDALILGILFGAVPILLCFLLVFIIGSSAGLTSDQFGPYALAALGAGLVIDITFLKVYFTNIMGLSIIPEVGCGLRYGKNTFSSYSGKLLRAIF